jgi:hypothetical protein
MRYGITLLIAACTASCNPVVRSDNVELQALAAQSERLPRDSADHLRGSVNPDALAAAALFSQRDDSAAALALIERASAMRPGDPDLAWLQAAFCGDVKECDPAPLEARFRSLDPDNALGWIGAIDRAYEANDQVALESSLSQAATLPVVDTRYTTSVARYSVAAVLDGKLSLKDALLIVAGELAGPALPRLVGVARSCGKEQLSMPARLEACRALARSMMEGDTVLVEMVGVAIAKRAWPEGSEEWKEAASARRIYTYRSRMLRDHVDDDLETEEDARAYLALLQSYPREQDLLAAQLAANAIEPMPPPDWKEPPPPEPWPTR